MTCTRKNIDSVVIPCIYIHMNIHIRYNGSNRWSHHIRFTLPYKVGLAHVHLPYSLFSFIYGSPSIRETTVRRRTRQLTTLLPRHSRLTELAEVDLGRAPGSKLCYETLWIVFEVRSRLRANSVACQVPMFFGSPESGTCKYSKKSMK